jgi:hypothetical protein
VKIEVGKQEKNYQIHDIKEDKEICRFNEVHVPIWKSNLKVEEIL